MRAIAAPKGFETPRYYPARLATPQPLPPEEIIAESEASVPRDEPSHSLLPEGAVGGATRRFEVAAESVAHLIPPLAS